MLKIKFRITFGSLILILFLFVSIKFLWISLTPMPGEERIVGIDIPKKFSAYQVAKMLQIKGLIKSTKYFQILMGLTGTSNRIKAGEYEFTTKMNMIKIVSILKKGKVKLHEVTIPEGFTIKEIALLLEKNRFVKAEDFIKTSRSEEVSKIYEIPVNNLEGYLFPDTYYFVKGMTPNEIIDIMVKRFKSVTSGFEIQAEKLGFRFYDIVIFASIIEKEAGVDEEKPLISAVFHNRLKEGQNLESCSTVIYAIGKKKKKLYDKDVLINSVYNTYKFPGLPPNPICNPGTNSIVSAINPANVSYRYFVNIGNKRHHFSATYKEHINAIRKFRNVKKR